MTEELKQEQNNTEEGKDHTATTENQEVELAENDTAASDTQDTPEENDTVIEATTEEDVRVDVHSDDVAAFTGDYD
jgi:hypothetical protein